MKNQNNDQKKNKIRESIPIVIFIIANIIVFIIFSNDLIDYIAHSTYRFPDLVFIKSFTTIILFLGTLIFFTAIYLPKELIYWIFGILEIIFLVLIIIFIIIDDGYYSVEAHIRRILYGFLASYPIVFLEYHLFRFLLNAIFSKESLKKKTEVLMVMSESEDSNLQQSWKDRFLQKIFRGISTFSFIPLVASIIAPMITFFLPVAYSIYYILKIPSTDVMLGVINLSGHFNLVLIISSFIIEFYFIFLSLLFLSIVTMAKEKKKGNFGLIQHGIYAKIRHPQNLAISLFLFLVFSLWDTLSGQFVIGHIISWGLFTLFLQLESLIEEKKLLKQFPDQYWAYIHKTGFFHFRLRKQNSIPPKLPGSESKYFIRRIILSVTSFILFYLLTFFVVMVLKNNNYDLLRFNDPLIKLAGGFYPDSHIVNEIVVVLVPIGIWLVSFIITIVNYLKEKGNKNRRASNKTEKGPSLNLTKLRTNLFWVFIFILIIYGLIVSSVIINWL